MRRREYNLQVLIVAYRRYGSVRAAAQALGYSQAFVWRKLKEAGFEIKQRPLVSVRYVEAGETKVLQRAQFVDEDKWSKVYVLLDTDTVIRLSKSCLVSEIEDVYSDSKV